MWVKLLIKDKKNAKINFDIFFLIVFKHEIIGNTVKSEVNVQKIFIQQRNTQLLLKKKKYRY